MKSLLALLLALAALAAPAPAAQSVTLSWNANSETNLAGYRMYWGTATRSYQAPMSVLHPTTSATVTNLQAGLTYYFAVSAYTTDGLESDYSDEVSYSVPPPPPTPPAKPLGLRVITTLQASSSPTGPWTNQWTLSQLVPIPADAPAGTFYRSQLLTIVE